jgi:hypothetical protein
MAEEVVGVISGLAIDALGGAGCAGSSSISSGVVRVEAKSGTGIQSICRRAER